MPLVTISVQFGSGLVLGYLVASLAESLLHRNVQHAGSRVRKFWLRHPRLFGPFLRAYFSHHVIHHARTYRRDFVTQFRDESEREALDRAIPDRYLDRIRRERYGLTLHGVGVAWFVLPIVPIGPLIFEVFGAWVAAGAALPMFVIYPCMSMIVHPMLHLPHDEAKGRAARILAWLLSTRYMKFVARNHYMHHRYISCNYNLMMGGDFLLGVYRSPGAGDLREMARLGLPAD